MLHRRNRLAVVILVLACVLLQLVPAEAAMMTAASVNKAILSMKSEYYEGRPWTNDDFYRWKGGKYYGGKGCVAFAFIMSDAAFGSLPSREIDPKNYDAIRVGDILRVNNDTHSVIVIEKYDEFVVIAEGNYNSSIHWGRAMGKQAVMNADECLTRYPDDRSGHDPVRSDVFTVPANHTRIEEEAFAGTDIRMLIIPSGVTAVEQNAFKDCKSLEKVYICYGADEADIDYYAFSGCDNVTRQYVKVN